MSRGVRIHRVHLNVNMNVNCDDTGGCLTSQGEQHRDWYACRGQGKQVSRSWMQWGWKGMLTDEAAAAL